ncbi:class III cytochrome C family protein [Fibrobacterota bacterium]
MKKNLLIVFGCLLICIYTLYHFPELMLNPGKLTGGHEQISNDCLKCHTPFRGVQNEKCLDCHVPSEIGIYTVQGIKNDTSDKSAASFHKYLKEKTCINCHCDHQGETPQKPIRKFKHDMLEPSLKTECKACHPGPDDALHQYVSGNCGLCHNSGKWEPASFAHGDHFLLDKDHKTDCRTCHPRNNFLEYTCYGCHEHQKEKTEQKHVKHNISDFSNCTECHRSADEHESERAWRSRKGKRGKTLKAGDRHKNRPKRLKHRSGNEHHDEHEDDDEHDDDD